MTRGGGGSIICISSDAAKLPWPFLTITNTSKAGVEGLVRGSALELAPLKIRVNAIRPGLLRTATNEVWLFEKNAPVIDQFIAEMPLGRTGVPDDVGTGVRYLAGPESAWVTGQSIGIEGGDELTKAPYLESFMRKRFADPMSAARDRRRTCRSCSRMKPRHPHPPSRPVGRRVVVAWRRWPAPVAVAAYRGHS